MLGDGSDRAAIAERMREEEHLADEATHDIIQRVNPTFVTPFDREDIYALASGLDDVMDFMEEAVDLVLLYEVARAARRRSPSRSRCIQPLRRAHRRGDAAAEDDEEPRRVLDRDQPPRERRRQDLPADPRQAVQRRSTKRSRCSSSRTSSTRSRHAIDAFEKVANTVEQIAVKES